MKKIAIALVILALCIPSLATAAGTLELEGSFEAARTVAVLAPYSGVVSSAGIKAGDALAAGDGVLSISATAVYADFDGTVTGVFAQPGDSAASVQERYGALLYLERTSLYTASCTTSGAGSGNENKIVHVGETVYLKSTQNEKRQGAGFVTSVQGSSYTVEVSDAGNLNVGDRVRVFRDVRHNSEDCIGAGAVSRIDPAAVTAEGYVLNVRVQDGQRVSRGDVLLEVVPDALAGLRGGDGTVRMPEGGVVTGVSFEDGARVEKDAVLFTYCPTGALALVCRADEDDLAQVNVGDEMTVTLDAYPDNALRGIVTKISGIAADDSGRTQFDVTLEVQDGSMARIGMSATAEK